MTRRAIATLLLLIAAAGHAWGEDVEFGASPFSAPTADDSSIANEKLKAATPKADIERGPRVGRIGDLKAIEFRGMKSFTADAIRSGLAKDLIYQAAARPTASAETYLRVLRERVQEGYRHSGRRAEVRVELGQPILVEIGEGPVQCCGVIRAADGFDLPEGMLQRIHEEVGRRWTYHGARRSGIGTTSLPDWESGKPFKADDGSLDQLFGHLIACCADFGIALLPEQLDRELVPRPSVGAVEGEVAVDLVLSCPVAEPIPIGSIEIQGLKRFSRQQVLDLVGLEEGEPLSSVALNRVCDRLERSMCFWTHKVELHLPRRPDRYGAVEKQAKLLIQVLEYEGAPDLLHPPSEVEQAALKVADWLRNMKRPSYDLQVRIVNPDSVTLDITGSPMRRSWLIHATGSYTIGRDLSIPLDHSVIVEPNEVTLVDWKNGVRIVWNGEVAAKFESKCKNYLDSDGKPKTSFLYGVGMQTDPIEQAETLAITPVSLLRLLRDCEVRRLENGVSQLESEDFLATFETGSGRVLSGRTKDDGSGVISVATEEQAFVSRKAGISQRSESFPVVKAGRDRLEPLIAYAADLSADYLFTDRKQAAVFREALSEEKLSAALGALKSASPHGSKEGEAHEEPPFEIPQTSRVTSLFDGWTGGLQAKCPELADGCFKRGSWPWTLLREAALLELHRPSREFGPWEAEMRRLHESDETGPLGMLAVSICLEVLDSDGSYHANEGLRRLNREAILTDIEQLTQGELWETAWINLIPQAAAWLTKEQHDRIVQAAPKLARTPLEEWFACCDTWPGITARDSVKAAILAAWDKGWLNALRAELRVGAATHMTPR